MADKPKAQTKPATKPPKVASDATPKSDPQQTLAQVKEDSPELILRKRLQAPFPATQIVWKRKGDAEATMVATLHTAALEDRLDETFGVDGWSVAYSQLGDNVLCELEGVQNTGTYQDDGVRRGGVGNTSEIAFRNACLAAGIGRYLLRVPALPMGAKGQSPQMPTWALPNTPDDAHPYVGCGSPQKAAPEAAKPEPPKPEPTKPEAPKSPPPKQQDARDGKTDYQLRQDHYAARLAECKFPDQATDLLREMGGEKKEHKKQLWDFIRTSCLDAGWKWDAEDMVFYAPLPDGESIPF